MTFFQFMHDCPWTSIALAFIFANVVVECWKSFCYSLTDDA